MGPPEIPNPNRADATDPRLSADPSDRVTAIISAAMRTAERATEVIHKLTGWNATVVLGGPDPKRGGGIHVVAYVPVFEATDQFSLDI
jgi:hypothetical protein